MTARALNQVFRMNELHLVVTEKGIELLDAETKVQKGRGSRSRTSKKCVEPGYGCNNAVPFHISPYHLILVERGVSARGSFKK